jgi:hypothetical protein
MPVIGIKNELQNGDLRIIPVTGLPMQTSWNLIWHKDKQFSPVAQAYLAYVEQQKEAIIRDSFGWYKRF